MDLLEDPEIKKKYEKCKYIVKAWESRFKKEHKRLPSKVRILTYVIENCANTLF